MKREGLELWASLRKNLGWKSVGKVDMLRYHVAVLRRLQFYSSYATGKPVCVPGIKPTALPAN